MHDDGLNKKNNYLQEFQGLFIESSAKDGKNVTEAVTELSRWVEIDLRFDTDSEQKTSWVTINYIRLIYLLLTVLQFEVRFINFGQL